MSTKGCELCTRGCPAKDIKGVYCFPIEINNNNTKERLKEDDECKQNMGKSEEDYTRY
jgi:hypothetical protein